jgi:hypothetical protein
MAAAKRTTRKKIEPKLSPAQVTQTIPAAEMDAAIKEVVFAAAPTPIPEPSTSAPGILATFDAGRWRMVEFALIGVLLFAVVVWIAPQKLGSMLWMTCKVSWFSYLAYWIGRRGAHLRISLITDPILRSQAQIAYCLLFAGALYLAGNSP